MIEPRRFFPAVAIGGAGAGAAIAIPVLGDVLRCCFCIGVMAGAGLSMKLWLDTHRAENLTASERRNIFRANCIGCKFENMARTKPVMRCNRKCKRWIDAS